MTLCPIAFAVGCQKCPALKICPLKGVLGDKPKAAAGDAANTEVRSVRQAPAKKMIRPKLARAKPPKAAIAAKKTVTKKAAPKKTADKAAEKPAGKTGKPAAKP